MSTRVHLLVYDLTKGMAAMMSQGILGQKIDGVWHSGVQVFDREYYFGGGIQVRLSTDLVYCFESLSY